MKYDNITEGIFIKRPNRFIAHVQVGEELLICHVKNTGRCRELLLPGVRVGLVYQGHPGRKTEYDLVSVQKNGHWVNMDSQMANDVAEEWLREKEPFGNMAVLRRECRFGNSRFDFYLEAGERKIFLEVKGVTLEEDGTARFPDAPTQRGVKHIQELQAALAAGYEAGVLFVVQMEPVTRFAPNWKTHPAFGEALCRAKEAGVQILAYRCRTGIDTIVIEEPLEICLEEENA